MLPSRETTGPVESGRGSKERVMIVSCPSCSARYQYDESRFGEVSTKKLKCSKCGVIFEVTKPSARPAEVGQTALGPQPGPAPKPRVTDETTKEFELDKLRASGSDEASLPQLAPLPRGRRYSLAVILGANSGQIYPLTKPRIVLGRGQGSDIQLPDSEISRRHAMIEIRGEDAVLIDLSSTNGTFVEGQRVQRVPLSSHQEFSIGTTTMMYIVTELPSEGSQS
jgi:predicted Zn finger-like uncharacterized protein